MRCDHKPVSWKCGLLNVVKKKYLFFGDLENAPIFSSFFLLLSLPSFFFSFILSLFFLFLLLSFSPLFFPFLLFPFFLLLLYSFPFFFFSFILSFLLLSYHLRQFRVLLFQNLNGWFYRILLPKVISPPNHRNFEYVLNIYQLTKECLVEHTKSTVANISAVLGTFDNFPNSWFPLVTVTFFFSFLYFYHFILETLALLSSQMSWIHSHQC